MKKIFFLTFFIVIIHQLFYSVEFKFVVIGDTRPPIGTDSYGNFEDQIKSINSLKPDFIINLGDLIFGYGNASTEKPWQEYKNTISKVKYKYYQIPGNHDLYSKKGQDIYNKKFKYLYYSFDFKNSHFILLNNSEDAVWGKISDKQILWLKNDLKKNKLKNIFVFMHFPLWDKKRAQVDKKYYNIWNNELRKLFKIYKVKAVFAGHVHSYGPTEEFDGIKYFITGGGGAELTRWYKEFGGQNHFMLINVKDDKYDYKIITDNGVLNEEEADVLKNHMFAEKYSNHAMLDYDNLRKNAEDKFIISLHNPYHQELTGVAFCDQSSDNFSITPHNIKINLAGNKTDNYKFKIKILNEKFYEVQYPKIKFNLKIKKQEIIFTKDIVLKKQLAIKRRSFNLSFNGKIDEWRKATEIILYDTLNKEKFAKCYATYDNDYLYLAAEVFDKDSIYENSNEVIFLNDALIVSFDRLLARQSHENNDLQLEFSNTPDGIIIYDRSKNEKIDINSNGIKFKLTVIKDKSQVFEIALPAEFLKPMILDKGIKFGFNIAYNDIDSKGKRKVIEWTPGIGFIGIDDSYQSQLNFSEAVFY